jgi:hypothetical protein
MGNLSEEDIAQMLHHLETASIVCAERGLWQASKWHVDDISDSNISL